MRHEETFHQGTGSFRVNGKCPGVICTAAVSFLTAGTIYTPWGIISTRHPARELLGSGAVLVDVRTTQEYRAGHAPAARHIPLDAIATRQRELSEDRLVVTVCRSGARSANAARQLAGAGYQVTGLRGGMTAWQRAGERVVAQNGRPGTVARAAVRVPLFLTRPPGRTRPGRSRAGWCPARTGTPG
ncbi:UNVERIFIED_CONTAM: rhodanese-like domain-containing protein [Kocuria sp. CPCC 205316]|uniref:rhodanese-like domain-containing protein n=1 Tax=Kocuria TaxID=57493 RepID=UPI0036D7BFC6